MENGMPNFMIENKKNVESCCRKGEKCYKFGKKNSIETNKKISISNLGKHRTEEHKRKYSECQLGEKGYWYNKSMSEDHKRKISIGNKGKIVSEETRQKLSRQKLGNKNPMYGKPLPPEHKRKCRLATIKRISKNKFNGGQVMTGYNTKACKFFNKLNEERGWNLQHAENGGGFHIKELGYWIDGYDKGRIL